MLALFDGRYYMRRWWLVVRTGSVSTGNPAGMSGVIGTFRYFAHRRRSAFTQANLSMDRYIHRQQ